MCSDELGRSKRKSNTYNTRDSLVVSDPTTDLALTCLTRGERTGSRIFLCILVVGAKYAEFECPGVREVG